MHDKKDHSGKRRINIPGLTGFNKSIELPFEGGNFPAGDNNPGTGGFSHAKGDIPPPKPNEGSNTPYCKGAKFSNSVSGDVLTATSVANGGSYTPNCASFMFYNNTNTVVTIANSMPVQPQGTGCFPELRKGCYNNPISFTFADPGHTGGFAITKIIKLPV